MKKNKENKKKPMHKDDKTLIDSSFVSDQAPGLDESSSLSDEISVLHEDSSDKSMAKEEYMPPAIPIQADDFLNANEDPDIQENFDVHVNTYERVFEPSARKKRRIKIKYLVIPIVALAIVLLFLNVIDVGNTHQRLASPLTIRGRVIPHDEFSFMFAFVLNEMGLDILDPQTKNILAEPMNDEFETFRDFALDVTAREMQTIEILYDDAIANGYSIDASHIERAQAYLDWLQIQADEIHVSLETYVIGVFGPNVTPTLILESLSRRYFAEEYAAGPKLEELKASVDQAEESYLVSKNQYDIVSYRLLRIVFEQNEPGYIATAHLHAHEIIERMDGNESHFERVAADFFSGEERERLLQPNATLVSNVRYHSVDDIEWRTWLFDPNRSSGDATIFEDDQGFPIILCFSSRQRQTEPLRNVRIFFIKKEDPLTSRPGIPRSEILPLAQSIYDSIDSEMDMIRLESIYASEINTGIMISSQSSDTYKGKFDAIFDEWIFDIRREPGDMIIIETPSQVAILYFVNISDSPEWFDRVNSFIRMNNYQAFLMEKRSEYPIVFNDEGLKHIYK